MAKVSASIGKELYRIEIKSASGNVLIADEPVESGGKDLGLNPKELLAAALSACTCATLRMYADRKQWDVSGVSLEVELERDEAANTTRITRKLQLPDHLPEEQRNRLLQVANSCPVHKILSNPITIETTLV